MACSRDDIEKVDAMRDLVTAVRNIRSEMRVPAKTLTDCVVSTKDEALRAFLESNRELVKRMAKVGDLRFSGERPPKSSLAVLRDCEVYVPLEGVVDLEGEAARIRKEVDNMKRAIAGIDAKFANPKFEQRAKPEVVAHERQRRAEFADKLGRLEGQLEALGQ